VDPDILFQPLQFRNLTVKNRLFRANISGRIDNYNGSGTPARIAWEEKFARGGVGAIISAHVPVTLRGRILPNYATIDRDERIEFWSKVVKRVHAHDCRFILQLSHSGHQQDIAGVENLDRTPGSSTGKPDFFNGIPTHAMTLAEIDEVVGLFVAGARRAQAAGCDGIELHACNGYLFTQFLSPAINDRTDEYGGSLENRARLLRRVVKAIRAAVGRDFHLQVKLTAVDYYDAIEPWLPAGTSIEDSIQVAQWLEADGVDALHVSVGGYFPHPRNPPGAWAAKDAPQVYESMLASGSHTGRNYLAFRFAKSLTTLIWERTTKHLAVEGISLAEAARIKASVTVPVISTGGYQRASLIRAAITGGSCDAVSIGRPLLANPNLPLMFAQGRDEAPEPCTFCNKCLVRVLEDPLGCYELSRFGNDYDRMMEHIMSFFEEGSWEVTTAVPPVTAGDPVAAD
jgi:2,4-dienoyl-CoA reductase-like NADH-dependent reductase (Old Yellow Enzyme family)